jgi:toxin HigB-1
VAIKTFKNRASGDIAELRDTKQSRRLLPVALHGLAHLRMLKLDAAVSLADLFVFPSYRLEKLKGDRKGQWSIRINDKYRICFYWKDGDVYGVEITDYH